MAERIENTGGEDNAPGAEPAFRSVADTLKVLKGSNDPEVVVSADRDANRRAQHIAKKKGVPLANNSVEQVSEAMKRAAREKAKRFGKKADKQYQGALEVLKDFNDLTAMLTASESRINHLLDSHDPISVASGELIDTDELDGLLKKLHERAHLLQVYLPKNPGKGELWSNTARVASYAGYGSYILPAFGMGVSPLASLGLFLFSALAGIRSMRKKSFFEGYQKIRNRNELSKFREDILKVRQEAEGCANEIRDNLENKYPEMVIRNIFSTAA